MIEGEFPMNSFYTTTKRNVRKRKSCQLCINKYNVYNLSGDTRSVLYFFIFTLKLTLNNIQFNQFHAMIFVFPRDSMLKRGSRKVRFCNFDQSFELYQKLLARTCRLN